MGAEIDGHDAVIRLNLAPDARATARSRFAPHRHFPTWLADVGGRTTWRVMPMDNYGYLSHYGRFWLKPPLGHGTHDNMSGIPNSPLLAIACHAPGAGRLSKERLRQTFAHQWSASYLVNPLLLRQWNRRYFRGVHNQIVPSTGMIAIAFASQLCEKVHIYGYGNGSCLSQCYHYYDCGETAEEGKGVAQSKMFAADSLASKGYHNFSAQATVLQQLASSGAIHPHWGTCEPSLGEPPAEFLNLKRRNARGAGPRRKNLHREHRPRERYRHGSP